MRKIIMIPARISSKRLPNKVLLPLGDKTILQRVYDQCIKVKDVDVYVATDSKKVKDHCSDFTENIIMTSHNHQSGTDRIIEALNGFENFLIVNVQGDEPFIHPELIQNLFDELIQTSADVVTACERITNLQELFSPNVVKVVKNLSNHALYFSRSEIPHIRNKEELLKDEIAFFQKNTFFKHVGIYGYTEEVLNKFQNLENKTLESLESLEQLRILENGYVIKVILLYF